MADMEKKYRKHTHREHILSLPDTYIGSIETAPEEAYVIEGQSFMLKSLSGFNPGLYKLFDELLVNAHDHVIRTRQRNSDHPVKSIEIAISADNKVVTITNDGEGIDVEEHPEHKVYIPQMVFGELLTSTNYDKEEKKLVGGKNGYGVKLANIFSTEFTVETVDAKRAKKYIQTFRNNMTVADPPKITTCKNKPYVSVSWTPDFARFKLTELPPDMVAMFRRRASDLAMTVGKEVKVTWIHGDDKQVLKCRNLSVYAGEHVSTPVVAAEINERWSVAVADTPCERFFQASFVNGIWTSKGGTHVDTVTNQIVNHIVEFLETKKKVKVKPSLVKESLMVFVNCLIENPSFSSQTKEVLTTKSNSFGSTCKLPDEFLTKVRTKLNLVESILEAQKLKDEKENKKSDGRKSSKIHGIPKLEDAVYAGTAKSANCVLILTEGDSAKAMALSGLSQDQRRFYGVFPLRGKLLNVKDTASSKIELAKEIADLKKIIGLESGKEYKDTSSLRYGSILIMTDQDFDGSHIRGLLINLFHELWHQLIAIPGFITYMATPIVKATRGNQQKVFYTQYEYEQWRETPAANGWKVKYYKGLGTSTRTEAQEYFKELNVMKFSYTPESDGAIDLAFNKSRANDRKDWLLTHDSANILLPHPDKRLPYDEFIHRDLIHFSYYNLERSIPNVMDGLKTSQRKILYAAFKRKLTSEIRVAQFAGYVSEHTGYHHGEQSLQEAIIGMAQDFVGANNINWFSPNGQFGTRLEGGSDAASPRYIHTHLSPEISKLVPTEDFSVLEYRDDDGLPVEPVWYAPVLPMVLVNGARGIGTGFSTFIPQYDPTVLSEILLGWLESGNDEMLRTAKLVPWVKGFKGTISPDGKGDFIVKVPWTYDAAKKTVHVRELPVGTWTSNFKATLSAYEEEKKHVKDFTDMSTDTTIHFDIVLNEDMTSEQIEKVFGLVDKLKTSNMHLFDSEGHIKKYESPNAILDEYAHRRLALYETRKEHIIANIQKELPYHEQVVRFIKKQTEDTPTPDLRRKTRAECDILLAKEGFLKIDDGFDYLLKLPVYSFTAETIAKHEKDLADLRGRLKDVAETTPAEMWKRDLRAWKEIKNKK
jgi:DNA topoisomerase-2